jgi:6-phosphogluconate dehydrogenase
MNIAVIGLGKMGHGIIERGTKRLQSARFFGFDTDAAACHNAAQLGATIVSSIAAFKEHAIDIFWLMLPAGTIIDTVLQNLITIAMPGTIIIDGGNSFYKDSQRRAQLLERHNLSYLDCGTSGGVNGARDGFCCMVGGVTKAYDKAEPLFAALSVPGGYAHVGSSGAGHYVKMVHNGIEYGLMQAYAEGLHILKEGTFKEQLDLVHITALWNTNSVIRSFLLSLAHDALQSDQDLTHASGKVSESGMGLWTDQEAKKHAIDDPVLAASLAVRAQSREDGGNYGTKILSVLRNKFGGHIYLDEGNSL